MDTVLFVDGENLKGKIKTAYKEAGKNKPTWHEYDFRGLFDKVLDGVTINRKVFYFARLKEYENSIEKSRQLIEEQRLLKTHLERQGFEVILSGRVRGQMENEKNGKQVLVFKEKGVDVKIAVDMVSLSCDKKVKEIILGSSDSDLQPAIKEIRGRKVSCVYLGFETQPNKGLSYTTNKTILIRNSELFEFEKIKVNAIDYRKDVYKRGNADVWWVAGMLGLLFAMWFLSGGPERPSSRAGPFIEPPSPLGSGEIYGARADNSQSRSGANDTSDFSSDYLSSGRRGDDGSSDANQSRYAGMVKISTGNARYEYQPNQEYITLEAGYSLDEPISITGWYVKNGKDERLYARNYPTNQTPVKGVSDIAVIPFATAVLADNGANPINEPVILAPGGRAVLTTGGVYAGVSPPITSSFRVNKCSGYLEDKPHTDFWPPLRSRCPEPEKEVGVNALDNECYDFVRRLPACHAPEFKIIDSDRYVDDRQLDLSRHCRDWVAEVFSYDSCLARHRADHDFFENEWRIFLGRRWELWSEDREIITLVDREGKVVDQVRY